MFDVNQVSLHGGQVLSWKTDRGEELLFTSSKVLDFMMFIVKIIFKFIVICNSDYVCIMWSESESFSGEF